ncbi:hypothetical protein AGMMS50239_29560 [Bacteroidia bacterium]|nr:hypothetical protein AGMMS50239_29560 [Bacteroidia bacterium]
MKLKKFNLSELERELEVLSEKERRKVNGGGNGTVSSPYTTEEYYMATANNTWNGGYVEGWGNVDNNHMGAPGKSNTSVIYDRSDHKIYLYAQNGSMLGSYDAYNNTTSGSNGSWPVGSYAMYDQTSTYTHGNQVDGSGIKKDSYSGSFGEYGIYRANPFNDGNTDRVGMGLHSGRGNDPTKQTDGCIRTTDQAMIDIGSWLSRGGSFTNITVRE